MVCAVWQLKPWFDEFGLSRLGFRLVERVEHAAAPPEIPDHPGFRVSEWGATTARRLIR